MEFSEKSFKEKVKEKREFMLNANNKIKKMQTEIQKLTQIILIVEGEARTFEKLLENSKENDKNKINSVHGKKT